MVNAAVTVKDLMIYKAHEQAVINYTIEGEADAQGVLISFSASVSMVNKPQSLAALRPALEDAVREYFSRKPKIVAVNQTIQVAV